MNNVTTNELESHELRVIAQGFLQQLADFLEDTFDTCDIEYHSPMLTITCPEGQSFVLHWHEASQQLWLASPFSGAWTFFYNKDKKSWYCSKKEQSLQPFIETELAFLKP